MHTFPISHQAIVMWSTLSALRHHSPDVSRPSVFSINSWGRQIIGNHSNQVMLTAKYFSLNQNISINSKLGYLAIMYLDALTIITVIALKCTLSVIRSQNCLLPVRLLHCIIDFSPGSPQSHGSLRRQLSQVDVVRMCQGTYPQPGQWHNVFWWGILLINEIRTAMHCVKCLNSLITLLRRV